MCSYRNLTFWNMGSLAGATWSMLAWLVPLVVVICALMLRDWRAVNALLLGEPGERSTSASTLRAYAGA